MGRQQKTSGADHNMMRELNRSLVLDVVKASEQISRAQIAKETSLAKPTVSAIVDDLIAEELITEVGVGRTTTGGGRPPILLEFNARSSFVVGIQIGVRRITAEVADARGDELLRTERDTPRGKPADVLTLCATIVSGLLAEAGGDPDRLAAAGVCVPGLTDTESGVCLLAPNLGWRDVPVRDLLHQALGVPVFVHNTSQAAAVAENLEGAGGGAKHMVLLYAGSGIGAGVISEGVLYHGRGGIAGEIGHCHVPGAEERCNCGRIGCLETVASAPAIARAAQQAMRAGRKSSIPRGRGGTVQPEDIAAAAAAGDALALELLAEAGRELGIATSWLVNLLNPAVVVVGGGLADAGEPLLRPLEQTALARALPQSADQVSIRASVLGQDAEVRGAVLLALQYAETYYRVVFQG